MANIATPQDGQVKQDCEINAAKRWLAAHAARYSTGNDTLLGDDLYPHQPFCRQVLLHNFHLLFTCKPSSHAHLYGWVEALAPGRQLQTLRLRVKGRSNRWEHCQYRWANNVPLTEGADPLKVNWCELTVTDAQGAVLYRNAFITDWKITADNVGARRKFFQHLEALTACWFFEHWEHLMDFMKRGQEVGPYAVQPN